MVPVNRQYDDQAEGLEVVPVEHLSPRQFPPSIETVQGQFQDEYPEHIYEMDPSSTLGNKSMEDVQEHEIAVPKVWHGFTKNRKLMTILALAIVVVLASILGGVLGHVVSQNRSYGSNDSTLVTISNRSRLSASNWTDNQNHEHRIVYFQDESNALISREWFDQADGWVTVNITDNVMKNGSVTPPLLAPGTAIASATSAGEDYPMNFGRWVWFIDRDNTLRCYKADNMYTSAQDSWENWEEMYQNVPEDELYPGGTDLAATTYWSEDMGRDVRVLVYQDDTGAVNVVNDSETSFWGDPWPLVKPQYASEPTVLAYSPYLGGSNSAVAFTWLDKNNAMWLSGIHEGDPGWTNAEHASLSGIDPTPYQNDRDTQFAVTTWDDGMQTMWLILQTNGTVASRWVNARAQDAYHDVHEVRFVGYEDGVPDPESPGWWGFAAASGGWVYALSGEGRIIEYKVDMEEPASGTLQFNSVVL